VIQSARAVLVQFVNTSPRPPPIPPPTPPPPPPPARIRLPLVGPRRKGVPWSSSLRARNGTAAARAPRWAGSCGSRAFPVCRLPREGKSSVNSPDALCEYAGARPVASGDSPPLPAIPSHGPRGSVGIVLVVRGRCLPHTRESRALRRHRATRRAPLRYGAGCAPIRAAPRTSDGGVVEKAGGPEGSPRRIRHADGHFAHRALFFSIFDQVYRRATARFHHEVAGRGVAPDRRRSSSSFELIAGAGFEQRQARLELAPVSPLRCGALGFSSFFVPVFACRRRDSGTIER
jgi:hypothetical protein